MTNVHIVYAHPSPRSFTRAILDAFLGGLDEAGHRYTVSDLYAQGFRSELTLDEYERESQQRADLPVPADVAAEEERQRWRLVRETHLARAADLGRTIGDPP